MESSQAEWILLGTGGGGWLWASLFCPSTCYTNTTNSIQRDAQYEYDPSGQGCGSGFFFADPDPAVFLNSNPDPAVFFNADPDPDPA